MMKRKYIKVSQHLNWIKVIGGNFPIQRLSNALSFKVPGYQYSNAYFNKVWDGSHRFFKNGKFPRGLLSRFLSFCKKEDIKVETNLIYDRATGYKWDKKLENVGFDTLSTSLRKYQIKAAKIAFLKNRGLISIPTAGGKTLIIVSLINFIGRSTLLLTYKKESLFEINELLKQELLSDSVGMLGGGIFEPRVFDIGSVQFIYRNRHKLKDYLNKKTVVIVDEAHHCSAKSWYTIVNMCNFAPWKLGFTATPSREPTAMLTEACIGPVIYKISSQYLIQHKFLSPPEITMINVNKVEYSGKELLGIRLDYRSAYFRGIETNCYRNNIIGELCKKLIKRKEYPAILTKTLEHVKQISEVLKNKNVKHVVLTGVSSTQKRLRILDQMRREKPRVIVFSTIFDEALDVPALKSLIIAGSGRSFRQTVQRMGRGMRIHKGKTKILVLDFFDTTHGYLESHSKIRKRIYEREGYKVRVVNTEEF